MTKTTWLKAEAGVSDDEPRGKDYETTVTPALHTLREYQTGLRRRLLEGFADRRAVLLWEHAVATVTLGQMADEWYHNLISDRWRMAALLDDPRDRAVVSAHPPDDEQARAERYDVRNEALLPAFNRAVELLRHQDVESDEETQLDEVRKQKWVAMRPRAHELATQQRETLEWALGVDSERPPIRTRQDIDAWVEALVFSVDGGLSPDLLREFSSPGSEWFDALTAEPSALLELLLASEILPVINRALRDAVMSGLERPETKSERPTPMEVG